ncbi:MAG: hypothetical protein GF317_14275 [Candidatus Lokiarchaeota archaeon]|nr:hypothetical protein [Candidatus Lokiarchaeota archaeon]
MKDKKLKMSGSEGTSESEICEMRKALKKFLSTEGELLMILKLEAIKSHDKKKYEYVQGRKEELSRIHSFLLRYGGK